MGRIGNRLSEESGRLVIPPMEVVVPKTIVSARSKPEAISSLFLRPSGISAASIRQRVAVD